MRPDGSDPGVCLAERRAVSDALVGFALAATAASCARTSHGRRLGGVPGRPWRHQRRHHRRGPAAIGLTRHGWCGRFIELGDMRSLPNTVTVGDLQARGIQVASVDRDPLTRVPGHNVATGGWLRPSLMAARPCCKCAPTATATGWPPWPCGATRRRKGLRATRAGSARARRGAEPPGPLGGRFLTDFGSAPRRPSNRRPGAPCRPPRCPKHLPPLVRDCIYTPLGGPYPEASHWDATSPLVLHLAQVSVDHASAAHRPSKIHTRQSVATARSRATGRQQRHHIEGCM